MQYTDNYKLDLYETGDLANLMDGYNHAMRLIDSALFRLAQIADAAADEAGDATRAVATITAQTQTLANSVNDLTVSVRALAQSVEATGAKVQTNTNAIAALDARVKNLEG